MKKILLRGFVVVSLAVGFFHFTPAYASIISSQVITGSTSPAFSFPIGILGENFFVASSTQNSACQVFSGVAKQVIMQVVNTTNLGTPVQYQLNVVTNNGGTITTAFATGTDSTSPSVLAFSFPSGVTIVNACDNANPNDALHLDLVTSGHTMKIVGTEFSSFWFGSYYAYHGSLTFLPYYIVSTDAFSTTTLNGLTVQVATSSSLFSGLDATNTLQVLAQQCSQAGNIFAEGICVAFSFLFVPNSQTLAQFTSIPQQIGNVFPFSYVSSAVATWQTLAASSTANAPLYQYKLADLGIGSTTPMGNILPNIDVMSSSTVTHFFPPAVFAAMKTLAGFAILMVLVADIFFTSRNLMH